MLFSSFLLGLAGQVIVYLGKVSQASLEVCYFNPCCSEGCFKLKRCISPQSVHQSNGNKKGNAAQINQIKIRKSLTGGQEKTHGELMNKVQSV